MWNLVRALLHETCSLKSNPSISQWKYLGTGKREGDSVDTPQPRSLAYPWFSYSKFRPLMNHNLTRNFNPAAAWNFLIQSGPDRRINKRTLQLQDLFMWQNPLAPKRSGSGVCMSIIKRCEEVGHSAVGFWTSVTREVWGDPTTVLC